MNRKRTIFVKDEIKAVFNFLKTPKNISNITEIAGITTITTDTLLLYSLQYPVYLQNGQIVTINYINYQVSNCNYSNGTFDVIAAGLVATSWHLACEFKFGSRPEINLLLDIESKTDEKKNMRYPFVWLFVNEPEIHDSDEYDFKTSLKMAFVQISKSEYKAEFREENIFKPVLAPLVQMFIELIQSSYFSKIFSFEYTKLNYDEYYRFFYGSADKDQMVFNAPTDAIEIDFDVIFQNQYN